MRHRIQLERLMAAAKADPLRNSQTMAMAAERARRTLHLEKGRLVEQGP